MENETAIRENIVEIARTVQNKIDRSWPEIPEIKCSKELMFKIISWAEEFERENADVNWGELPTPEGEIRDYYIEIDAYAEKKFLEDY